MGKIKSYEDLFVFQKADDLAVRIYEVTTAFPKHELYGLVSQMRRAAVSVPSNIVEGFTSHTRKEYVHFLRIAWGSLAELEYQIKFSKRIGYLKEKKVIDELVERTTEIGKMLNGLISKLKTSN
ncbi:hypothetical protein A3D81_00455 [Candidatus Curtissbacteria bacterium RIFCSPHIGHO2_02_FULL_40_17]|uniref:Four helix bundle protein n=2 Tax=Microgenomates group TaxID=1794810 RepID=A0A1F7JTB2_9BACT|nr:MAG: hypothetical protein A3D81_00455 [Candidatus Curtissbacteria bacterium RIFCSPHIGHO2_02_FULL_40_17]OGK58848.1 MAG: hypothetical protein A3I56_00205 [Candidatus Roizmanbacteria bacterium RIFCSPLOWO2_02_FULL_43_10]